MSQQEHNKYKTRLDEAIDAFKRESGKFRTGRANTAMLDHIRVDYYGTSTPLNQMAALHIADPRTITIKPWDKAALADIEKTLQKSELGIQPVNDGEQIRLVIPPMTEDRRKDLVKQLKKAEEDCKVAMRNARRDINEDLKKLQKDGAMTEDDLKRDTERVQKVLDEYTKKLDDLFKKKQAELMEV
ncbi:MAG: Ribosome-recycling factor [Myxococcota bacterium]|nr:Ribosome-recycling factor [Myxococcota bacterium]